MLLALFVLVLAAALLAVAVAALRRQVHAARLTMLPLTPARWRRAGEREKAPLVSAPSLAGGTLTIGGASRDARFVLLVFVEPGSASSDEVVEAAVDLCRDAAVRLVLVGDGSPSAAAEIVPAEGLEHVEYILSEALREDFRIGPVPSAALLDAEGYLVARGTVQHRRHLESLLAAVREPAEPA